MADSQNEGQPASPLLRTKLHVPPIRLETGDRVRVDGGRGIVEILASVRAA